MFHEGIEIFVNITEHTSTKFFFPSAIFDKEYEWANFLLTFQTMPIHVIYAMLTLTLKHMEGGHKYLHKLLTPLKKADPKLRALYHLTKEKPEEIR